MPRRILPAAIALGLASSEAILIYAGANLALTLQGQPAGVPYGLLLALLAIPLAAGAIPLGPRPWRRAAGAALAGAVLLAYVFGRFLAHGSADWPFEVLLQPGLLHWTLVVGTGALLRGTALANRRRSVSASFRAGIAALFGFWALWALIGIGREAAPELPVPLSAYFAIALPLLAMERVETARQRSAAPARRALTFSLTSLLAITLLAAGILAGAVTLAAQARLLRGAAPALLTPLDAVIRVIAWPLGLLVEGAVALLKPFTIYRRRAEPTGHEAIGAPVAGHDLKPLVAGAIVLAALLVLAAAVLLAWLRRHRAAARVEEAEAEDERESLWNWKDLWSRFRRPAAAPPPSDALVGDDPRIRVRRLYRQFLGAAARQRMERAPATTPLEFWAVVRETRPEVAPQLSALTQAYLVARYARDPPGAPLVTQAEEALRQVLAALGADRKR